MRRNNKNETKLEKKLHRKNSQENNHSQFYYSFLTVILLVCFIQMSVSALLNVTKIIAYHRKMSTLESKRIAAEARNTNLKKEIKNFSTTESMEAIARNNLKMAKKDELVVILNKKNAVLPEQKNKHKKVGHKK